METLQIMNHPTSGERYILGSTRTPDGVIYRAAGPMDYWDQLSASEMRDYLDNQGYDAYDDGEWLANELELH